MNAYADLLRLAAADPHARALLRLALAFPAALIGVAGLIVATTGGTLAC